MTTNRVESPCVRRCFLNEDDMCLGCFRTLEEICGWNQANDAQRKVVLAHCTERETHYKQQQAERMARRHPGNTMP